MLICQRSRTRCVEEPQLTVSEILIERQEDLDRVIDEVSDIVGIDTEFYVRRTFFRIPCLLQIATPQNSYVIDLAAPLNLKPIETLMRNSEQQKVMHAAGEDLKILYYLFGEIPAGVVDTQLAHAFVSPEDQRSYHGVVKEHLEIELNQSSSITTSNWSKRPLSKKQLEYAVDDVQYLLPLSASLFERLRELGRLEWFEEEMGIYLASQDLNQKFDLSNVQGLRKLAKHEQSFVILLAEWRESLAKRSNVPRRWIASDEQLVWSVQHRGESIGRFRDELGVRLGGRLHKTLRNGLRNASDVPLKPAHSQFERQRFHKKSSAVVRMKEIVQSKSEQLQISRNLLGNQGNLIEWSNFFSHSGRFPSSFGRWREMLLGSEFREVLRNPYDPT